ncbi:MAG: hypothetical protein IT475_05760 [Aquimonas sp.]|nr:hypothetical protein [Aquimonas sp.]
MSRLSDRDAGWRWSSSIAPVLISFLTYPSESHMKFNPIVAALVGSLVIATPASAATLQRSAPEATQTAIIPAPTGAAVVLYDQTNNPAANGAPDQDFETSFDSYDAEGADDFVVTDNSGWTITQVNTVGTTGTPGGASVDLTIYSDDVVPVEGFNVPGTPVCTYSGIIPTDTAGSFQIGLPTACVVGPGTYWVAIQTNQAFASNGQHFWSNRSTQSNSPAVWRNPGDGFGSGCTNWTPMLTCATIGGNQPDFLFQIVGTVGGFNPLPNPVPQPDVIPASDWRGLSVLALLMGLGALAFRRFSK